MKKLGVNIDHIATLRNARGEDHPNILFAAKYAYKKGANSITIHLREDRRHIKDEDFLNIKKIKKNKNLNFPLKFKELKLLLNNQCVNEQVTATRQRGNGNRHEVGCLQPTSTSLSADGSETVVVATNLNRCGLH